MEFKAKIVLHEELNDEVLKDILELEKAVFPRSMTKDKLVRELSSKFNTSILIAYHKDQAIGYKVGFERSKRIYYSWIGGVLPQYRGFGVAKLLMKQQHDYARTQSYKVVCTQTNNSFKPMLILNLKYGFEIKGTIQSTGDDYLTIILEKAL